MKRFSARTIKAEYLLQAFHGTSSDSPHHPWLRVRFETGRGPLGVLFGTDERPEEWALRLLRWKPKPLITRLAKGFETDSKGHNQTLHPLPIRPWSKSLTANARRRISQSVLDARDSLSV
jgi:hypothetical protein